MKDVNKIINGLSRNGLLSGLAGGLAGGTLAGALTGKSGKKIGKTALKVGALAAVSGVAWKAYQSYSRRSNSRAGAPVAVPALEQRRFDAVVREEHGNKGPMLVLRAMIAAAHADGHVDQDERQQIFAQVEKLDLSIAEKAALFDELKRPLDLNALVRLVPDSETAIEVYTASLLAIDEAQPASERYLQDLARSLRLPDDLVKSLHFEVAMTKSCAPINAA